MDKTDSPHDLTFAGLRALAEWAGVHRDTVRAWVDGGLPHEQHGKVSRFSARDVVQWLARSRQTKPTVISHKERLERLKADRLELQLARERGELISLIDVRDTIRDIFLTCRTHLLAARGQFEDKAQREAWERICREALTGACEELEKTERMLQDGKDMDNGKVQGIDQETQSQP